MHVTDRSKTVVMLIDWDNLQICHSRDAPGTELDLQALIALAQSYGTLVSARAYAEWNLLAERLAVYKAGIEPVFAPVMRPEGSPREGKSLADTVMVADGVDLLWTVAPDVFVLATSDKDMIPLARIAKQRGAAVVVLGSDLTAIPLVEMSNVFITYRQLLRELDRVSELEAPVGRAPARERRLRESRRPSSEPYTGGIGTGGGIGGGRGGPRSVGAIGSAPTAPTPLPAAGSPRRRPEPVPVPVPAPAESERALAAPATTAPTPEPPAASDAIGIGNADVAPRRRRRRGGRGRRSGLGGLGDAEAQGETMHDTGSDLDVVDHEDENEETATAPSSTPDDIDTAVLELLASRDREAGHAAGAEVASTVDEPAAASQSASFGPAPTPVETAPSPPRRRMARTSFSAFGPPEVSIRPIAPTPSSSEPAPPAESASEQPEAVTAADEPAAVTDQAEAGAAEGLVPAPIPEAAPEPVAIDQVGAAGEADATTSSDTDATVSTDAQVAPSSNGRTARSGRTGRTGTRRARGTGATATGSNAEGSIVEGAGSEGAEGSGEGARAPRRRRTRRPAGGSSPDSSGDAVTVEAGG